MNDTGGGVTAIHDVPGDITRIGFHWMLFFPFCHSKGASICSSHGVSRRSRGFFVPRLVLGPTDQREVICEFANFFSSHGESRRSRIFFVPRLVLGPTDRREVIREFFLHTDCRGIIFFITNYRIIEYLSHGMSRKVTDFFVPRLVLGPTDQREVIAEFL